MAFDIAQPFILSYPGSGNQTLQNSDGTPYEPDSSGDDTVDAENANQLLIVTPQSGPPVIIEPDGTPVNLDAGVLMPYSQTTSPGVIVVG